MAKKPKQKNIPQPLAKNSQPKTVAATSIVPHGKWRQWALGLLALLITFIIFYPTLALQFVNWDDSENLLKNKSLEVFAFQWDWEAVKNIFTSPVMGNYNPLPIFTFAIEKYFWANDPHAYPFIFHLNNLLLHLGCTWFVYVLLLKLNLSRWPAFVGALLFGIHPMRVESVAWVTERKDVLYGIFFVAALVCYVLFIQKERGKYKWYILALVLSIFSYFAKIQAVTLPLSMVAIDFILKRKWLSPKILILEKLPWWILSLIFGLVNIYFLKSIDSIDLESPVLTYSWLDRFAVGAYAYATYLVKWIYPFKMSALYPYSSHVPTLAFICLAIVPIVLAAVLIWAYKRRKYNLLFGIAFFTFNIMFLLQIVAAGQGYLADRFTYIAYIGLFFLNAKGFEWVMHNKPQYRTGLYAFTAILFVFYGFLSMKQIKVWENGGTLWGHVIDLFPNSALAHKNMGNYYREEEKNYAKAIEFYKRGIEMEPKAGAGYNSLAKSYFDYALSKNASGAAISPEQITLVQSAIESYNKGLQTETLYGKKEKKTLGEMTVNKGVAYAYLSRFDSALLYLSEGLKIAPDNNNAHLNRALVYLSTNKPDLALTDFSDFLKADPYNADVIFQRGTCYAALGKNNEALADFSKAISLKTTNPIFFLERAKLFKTMGNAASARVDAQKARAMGMQVPSELLP